MIGAVILGLALLVGLILIAQWFVSAEPRAVVRVVKVGGATLAVVALVVLAVSRAWQWLPALLILGLPWFMRARGIADRMKAARGPSGGGTSSVKTAYLDMSLDHDTGAMWGTILRGRFAGERLARLSLSDLLVLLEECRLEDEQSVAVLTAYLDRAHPGWREDGEEEEDGAGRHQRPPPRGGRMTREEARQILGVEKGATPEDIKEAHRRLMKQVHPDQGGSSYLAAKINEAKEVLLGH